MTSPTTKRTIRLYGCGGTGINCISIFDGLETNEPNCGEILTSYIDTSRSNMKSHFSEGDCYLLKGVDGSGKIRRENHREISESIKQILLEHKPGDFNIVVSSASGGTGSVFGPLLMSELLKRGESAVYFLIGSAECTVTATNTLNTLKSLASIVDRTDSPVVMFYEHNDDRPRSEVDSRVRSGIAALAALASGLNSELDSRDISNWLRFNYSTKVPAQLALMEVYTDPDPVSQVVEPIAIASLYRDPDQPKVKAIPEYSCVGYMPKADNDNGYNQLHMVITVDGLSDVYEKVGSTVSEYNERRDGRTAKLRMVSDHDTVSEDGLVF